MWITSDDIYVWKIHKLKHLVGRKGAFSYSLSLTRIHYLFTFPVHIYNTNCFSRGKILITKSATANCFTFSRLTGRSNTKRLKGISNESATDLISFYRINFKRKACVFMSSQIYSDSLGKILMFTGVYVLCIRASL